MSTSPSRVCITLVGCAGALASLRPCTTITPCRYGWLPAQRRCCTQALRSAPTCATSPPSCRYACSLAWACVHATRGPQVHTVIRRLLHGGALVFPAPDNDSAVRRETPRLSLAVLGRLLREALVERRPSRSAQAKAAREAHRLLDPAMSTTLDEERVKAFVARDSVLLGPWSAFHASLYTQSNAFFDADGAHRCVGLAS